MTEDVPQGGVPKTCDEALAIQGMALVTPVLNLRGHRSPLRICRLNVHEDVGDARICGADRIFHSVRQLVAFVDGNAAIH